MACRNYFCLFFMISISARTLIKPEESIWMGTTALSISAAKLALLCFGLKDKVASEITGVVYLPNSVRSVTLVLYQSSLDNSTVVSLEEAENLIPKLNLDLITIIYGFGFTGSDQGQATKDMMSSYIECENYNVILTNWTEEASNPYPIAAQGYITYALPNCVEVGNALGLALVKLVSLGMAADKVHLIGLSLGAHMMGYAGRRAKLEGVTVYRTTGLDPAGLGFEPSVGYTPINEESGGFVDCYHTDIGGCGMRSSPCHINFYYNAENFYSLTGSHVQPGCEPGFELCGNLCSHNRSVYYWIEALKFIKNFLAGKANSYFDYANANGVFDTATYVGYLCNITYRGDFYLSTNAESPYGKQEAGLQPSSSDVI